MNARFVSAIVGLSLLASLAHATDAASERKAAAQNLATRLSALLIHKIYVFDFVDASGESCLPCTYISSSLSQSLKEKSKQLVVAGPTEAVSVLTVEGKMDTRLSRETAITRLASALTLDAIVWGTVSKDSKGYRVHLEVRDPSGKLLLEADHHELTDAYLEWLYSARPNLSRARLWFPGVDGISTPKCSHAPLPQISPDLAGAVRSGKIVLVGVITTRGTVEQLSVLQGVSKDVDDAALSSVQTWRCGPAVDSSGKPIAVSAPFEVTFSVH